MSLSVNLDLEAFIWGVLLEWKQKILSTQKNRESTYKK